MNQVLEITIEDIMPSRCILRSLYKFLTEIPCTTNPLGSKGAGEAGTMASAPVIVSAILDALAGDGVRDLDMPVTSERIWNALQRAVERTSSRNPSPS